MKNLQTAVLSLVLAGLVSPAAMAQLPELGSPSSISGAPTTARFFGGASADNGSSFASSFGYDQAIDVDTEIQVESSHVNTMGNLYVFIVWDGLYFQRVESGDYEIWDLSLPNLQAAFPAKTLQASEPINIVNDVAFGPAGVSDTTLAIFLAYDSMAAPGEIFYSGAPLSVAIESEQTTAASLQLYVDTISSPIIQAKCIICHQVGGVATDSALHYVNSGVANFQTTNYNTLVNYIKNVPNGSSEILSRPQGMNHTGGVQLTPSSQDFLNLQAFVNQVLAE
ncbi:MAG: hypothetical protein O2971_02780 [Proteobacteria bacterium]|nr:hypothetical protein [Pseudomonadota bacterium]